MHKRTLMRVNLCASHGSTRMNNNVVGCRKSQHITIWMCGHSSMCGYDSASMLDLESHSSTLWELKGVSTSHGGAKLVATRPSEDRQTEAEVSVRTCRTGGLGLQPPRGHVELNVNASLQAAARLQHITPRFCCSVRTHATGWFLLHRHSRHVDNGITGDRVNPLDIYSIAES